MVIISNLKVFDRNKTVKFCRCTKRSCNVILHTNLDDTFIKFSGTVTDHNHLPNPADLKLRDVKKSMKTRATTELLPLKDTIEQEMRNVLLTGEVLAILPGVDDISMIPMFDVRLTFRFLSFYVYYSSYIETPSTQNGSYGSKVIFISYSGFIQTR